MNKSNLSQKKYIWYIVGALIFITMIIWAFIPSRVNVDLAEVKYGKFVQFIEEDAKTRATKIYTITAPVTGRILRIQLTEGDLVDKGDKIAIIQPVTPSLLDVRTREELEEALGAAQAKHEEALLVLENAKASLATALSDLNRKKPLVIKGYVTQSDFEHTELEYNIKQKAYHAAERQLHAAAHEVERLKASLSHLKANNAKEPQLILKAPIKGRILRINQKSEATIAQGTSIVEIADVAKLEIVADILSTDAALIPQNARVIIKRWGGSVPLEGKVRIIEPSAYTKISALGVEEQRVNVIIDIITPQQVWKNLGDAYRVDVEIILFEAEHALIVPMSAVFRDGNDWAVFLNNKGIAVKQKIIIKWYNREQAVVEHGLKAGDKVIIYPSSLVYENIRIKEN